VADSSFISNGARIAGAIHALSSGFCLVRLPVLNNNADYDGEIPADSEHGNCSLVELVNVCANTAVEWTGKLCLNYSGRLMHSCWFDGDRAAVHGGFFDCIWSPTNRNTNFCTFWNNASISGGGVFTTLQILRKLRFEHYVFALNLYNNRRMRYPSKSSMPK
jgi:hypothetical protein